MDCCRLNTRKGMFVSKENILWIPLTSLIFITDNIRYMLSTLDIDACYFVLQWCSGCSGPEALLLSPHASWPCWPDWEASQLCPSGKIIRCNLPNYTTIFHSLFTPCQTFSENVNKNVSPTQALMFTQVSCYFNEIFTGALLGNGFICWILSNRWLMPPSALWGKLVISTLRESEVGATRSVAVAACFKNSLSYPNSGPVVFLFLLSSVETRLSSGLLDQVSIEFLILTRSIR